MINKLVFILFVATLIVLLLFRTTSKNISGYCQSDSDCGTGYKCISNPELGDKKQCFPYKSEFCSIEVDKLKECDPNNTDSCDSCLNEPSFSCLVVDDNHPYTWKQGDKTIKVPNSNEGKGWCLPDVKTDKYCNPNTSDYILIETSPNRYEWGCFCKYPNLFTSAEPGGDCNIVRACGNENNDKNNLFVPLLDKPCTADKDCGNDEFCLTVRDPAPCGTTSDKKVCHTAWNKDIDTQHNINPLTGQCVCDVGLKYQCLETGQNVYRMNCIPDSCGIYGSTTDCSPIPENCVQTPRETCCNCPTGYLKCPEDIPPTNTSVCVSCLSSPKCIPDPCAPLGYYDRNTQRCVCTAKGSAPKTDEDSAVGEVCVDLCENNGPCGYGAGTKRGDCYVTTDESGRSVAKCCSCVLPFGQDKTGLCQDVVGSPDNLQLCQTDKDCKLGKCVMGACLCGDDHDCGFLAFKSCQEMSRVPINSKFYRRKKCMDMDTCKKS